MEQRFKFVGKLIRPHRAQIAQPWSVMRECGRLKRLFQRRIVQPVEFECEKQQPRRDRRHALLHVAVEFSMHGIRVVLRIEKPRKGHQAAETVLDRFVGADGLGELHAAIGRVSQRCDPAAIACIECFGVARRRREIGFYLRRTGARIEVGEIPCRQGNGHRKEFLRGNKGRCHLYCAGRSVVQRAECRFARRTKEKGPGLATGALILSIVRL